MWRWQLTVITAISCGICTSHACGPAEYEVKQECCPMCAPGYYVFRHCTEYTSTTCAPCPSSTYTDEPHGLESCRPCTVCDHTAGLRVKKKCSSTSDTLCEPLEGHYCTHPIKDGCRGAVEHTKCSPGQYIRQHGTALSDTVCDSCGNNTYSNGSFSSCKQHIQCQPGYKVTKEGTPSSDTECQNVFITPVITVTILVLLAVAVFCVIQKLRKKWQRHFPPDPGITLRPLHEMSLDT